MEPPGVVGQGDQRSLGRGFGDAEHGFNGLFAHRVEVFGIVDL